MKISILTLFPEMFVGPFDHSIIKHAKEKKLVDIDFVNIRDFGQGKHKTIDDKPYGGGVGMVMKVDVLDQAIQSAKDQRLKTNEQQRIILLDPRGKPFTQKKAQELSKLNHLILICGHYEGIDERVRDLIDEEISLGDFVLTGGEIPAMAIADSVVRLIPEVLKQDATTFESFSKSTLEYPQYTNPRIYKDKKVPEVLLSGNHQKIASWKEKTALQITKKNRPDLLK